MNLSPQAGNFIGLEKSVCLEENHYKVQKCHFPVGAEVADMAYTKIKWIWKGRNCLEGRNEIWTNLAWKTHKKKSADGESDVSLPDPSLITVAADSIGDGIDRESASPLLPSIYFWSYWIYKIPRSVL